MALSTFRGFFLLLAGLLLGLVPGQAQRLATGLNHTVNIHADGTLWAWGDNYSGQLGIGPTTYQPTPVQVGTGTDWVSVAAGSNFTLAIRADGTLWAWGDNGYGSLGLGATALRYDRPVQVGTDNNWRRVSAGPSHTLALRTDGTLWAWGLNNNGQLGLGTTANQNTPAQVGTATWTSVSAGAYHTVAVRPDGTLWGWGVNDVGQLGLGSYALLRTPQQVGTATTWQSVAAGFEHTLALRTDGTLWAWGNNARGQAGASGPDYLPTPTQVGTATWQRLAAGGDQSAAVRRDGTLWTWGRNNYGQLGLGTTTDQQTLSQVGTLATWESVAISYYHAVALRTDGTLWGWGSNALGQLGNGPGLRLAPVQLSAGPAWKMVSPGDGFTLAIRADGTLWGWGSNRYGQLGAGTNSISTSTPRQVSPGTTWLSVSTGVTHTVAVRQDGTLWAWGNNGNGQLGLGPALAFVTQSAPVQVGTATTWVSVSAGYYHTLALQADGSLWGTGSNDAGQTGISATTNQEPNQLTLQQVNPGTTWRSVSAGGGHSLAVRTDGTLWAWGHNYEGQLGTTAAPAGQSPPRQVGTATTWASVSAGRTHSVAVRQDGTLWAWGDNDSGQLGLGTTTNQYTPAQVGTATTWASATAGLWHTVAMRADGSLWTWGDNSYGQLGLGTTDPQLVPARVGTAAWQRPAASCYGHSAAIRPDGTLWLWGYNLDGQLGQPHTSSLPILIPNGGTPLATARVGAASAWSLFPNPAHARVQLTGLPAGPLAVRLFDAQGRLVRSAATPSIGLEGLAPGLYLLRASAGPATQTLRLAVD